MSIKQKLMLCLIIMLIIPLVLIVLLALIMGAALVLFHPAVELSLTGGIEISDPVTVKFLIAWAIAAVCIIISGVVAVTAYLSHSILKPIKELTVAMERLKNGDLSYEFSGSVIKRFTLFAAHTILCDFICRPPRLKIWNTSMSRKCLLQICHTI